jgi:hypothetical protein
MKAKKYVWIIISFVLIVISASVFFAFRYLPAFLHRTLKEKVSSLQEDGIYIQYDSLQLSLGDRTMSIDTISIDIPKEKMSAEIYGCNVRSFNILRLIFRRDIHLGAITADIVKFSISKKKEKARAEGEPVTKSEMSIFINTIDIKQAFFRTGDSISRDTMSLKSRIDIEGLTINNTNEEQPVTVRRMVMDSLVVDFPFYTLAFGQLQLDREHKRLTIDTLRLRPRFSKHEHARRKRVEDDRFHGMVTSFVIEGLNFATGDSVFVNASSVKFKLLLDVFRNKHYSFPKRDYMPLPVDALAKLPFGLNIDTLRLIDSRISYEEIGEEADSSGTIYFDKLKAGIFHISTDKTLPPAFLEASSSFMGKGTLVMTCQFSNTKEPAVVKGSLSNFPLTRMNDMLGPQAKIQVESGTMLKLNFSFKFNDIRSDGAVDMSYKDLRIASLRKDKDKDKAVRNNLLTLAINTFIKDDAGRYVTGEKQTGVILFYRDRKKAIFNYWWKSLFSGIKSSFALRTQQTDQATAEKNARKDVKKRKRKKE